MRALETNMPATEVQQFHQFLSDRHDLLGGDVTLDQAVEQFRAYQRERDRCREAIQPALDRTRRGETPLLNMDAIKAEVADRLAKRGIPGP
jgi:hypothetical protein